MSYQLPFLTLHDLAFKSTSVLLCHWRLDQDHADKTSHGGGVFDDLHCLNASAC